LKRLDIVVANAGIAATAAPAAQITEEAWRTMLDVNLTGVWHATTAATPHLSGGGGCINIVSPCWVCVAANTWLRTAQPSMP
jgi:NAD(P)-dependent dehydrogenase (short-subunit alcohol dehydrogenase family)